MTQNKFMNISNFLFKKRVEKDLLSVKNVNDITNFIYKWKDYFLNEDETNDKLLLTHRLSKEQNKVGLFITVVLIDNDPQMLMFNIYDDTAEYAGIKKVSEQTKDHFSNNVKIPPKSAIDYMLKMMKFKAQEMSYRNN